MHHFILQRIKHCSSIVTSDTSALFTSFVSCHHFPLYVDVHVYIPAMHHGAEWGIWIKIMSLVINPNPTTAILSMLWPSGNR